MTERLLQIDEVKARVALSKTELYRRIKEGRFPRQVRLSSRRVAWVESEITDWIRAARPGPLGGPPTDAAPGPA